MLLQGLREQVLDANLELVRAGLVLYTFGNASGIDRDQGVVAIKPSGVPYNSMRPADIVLTDLEGKVIEGGLKPSSDLKTHLVLYREFSAIGGVVHTHSTYATAWAQAQREIPAFGTTHADYFYGPVPVTQPLTDEEIEGDYVLNTGLAIIRRFQKLNPKASPAVLVAGHAPFCWGATPADAAHHAVVLEYVAQMAFFTAAINPASIGASRALIDRHYFRKHGPDATYGQSPDRESPEKQS
jgi:L-ribulose-5-phosphate 4-epimerase